jgi:hypothetical protein
LQGLKIAKFPSLNFETWNLRKKEGKLDYDSFGVVSR